MQNSIVFICGRKGCGKTTLASKMTRRLCRDGRRVLVVAPMGGFSVLGSPVIRDNDLARFAALKGRSALVLPESDDLARTAFAFAWQSQLERSSPLWLIVDEIDLYFGWRDPDPSLRDVVRYGRHRHINLIGISQRPANVHNDLLAQADRRIIFQTIEPNDLAYLKKYIGLDPELAQALPMFEYLVR